MRKTDCVWLAARTAFSRRSVLFVAGIAVAVYCACAGGGLVSGVQTQINMPFELNATAGDAKITDSIVAQAAGVEGVVAVSAEIEAPVTLSLGGNTAGIKLDGLDPDYMQGTFSAGTIFPKDSVMPYIVLNQAAFDQLQDKNKNGIVEDDEKIDWQKAACSIQSGDNSSQISGVSKSPASGDKNSPASGDQSTSAGDNSSQIAAQICGILADGNKDPEAYISLSAAKKLAGGEYTACLIRIKNVNIAKDVSDKITLLGLTAADPTPPQQPDWDRKNTEATYLLLLAAAALSFAFGLSKWGYKEKEMEMLLLTGFSANTVQSLFGMKNGLLCSAAFGFGLLAYVLVPQLISPDMQTQINIAFPFQLWGMLTGAGFAVLAIFICNGLQTSRLKRCFTGRQ